MAAEKRNAEMEPRSIWNPMFISVFVTGMAVNLSLNMSNSLLSVYADAVGAPADQIGSLMSMFAITAIIFRFMSGPAMNSFNLKKLLMISICFFTAAYLGFSFAPSIAEATGLPTITVLKVFRLIQGVGNAFGNSCLMTVVADFIPKDKFTSGMGFYACSQVVGQALGPAAGVWLRDAFGYHVTYLIVAVIMFSALILVATIVRVKAREPMPFRLTPRNMIAFEALVPAAVTFLVHMAFITINSFLLLYSEKRGIQGGSWFFTIYAVTLLATRPVVGKLIDRFGFVKMAVPSILMTVFSLVVIGCAPNTLVLLSAAVINAFGYGAVQPALQSLCIKAVTPERRGSASSTNYLAQDAATLIGPQTIGRVAKILGYVPTMWYVITIPVLLGMAVILIFRKRIAAIEENFAKRI